MDRALCLPTTVNTVRGGQGVAGCLWTVQREAPVLSLAHVA